MGPQFVCSFRCLKQPVSQVGTPSKKSVLGIFTTKFLINVIGEVVPILRHVFIRLAVEIQ